MFGNKKFSSPIVPILITLATVIQASGSAEARLGEDFEAYKTRMDVSFKPAGQKDNVYMFQLITNPQQAAASPGYAGGLQVTVNNGKVAGEMLVLRLGMQPVTGATMATVHGLMFVYEALGRQASKDKSQINNEIKSFGGALEQAYAGHPQNIRYPGNPALVTVSKDSYGNFVINCRNVAAAAPSATAGPGAQKPAAHK